MPEMDFRTLFKAVLDNYLVEKQGPFENNWLAKLIRHDFRSKLQSDYSDLLIQGSAGQGNWASVPWVAFFDKTETTTAQEGIYVVYLFSEDMQRLYLTFNQGVTTPITSKGKAKALEWLRLNADKIALAYPNSEFMPGEEINLGESDLAIAYEKACIYYKEYPKDNLPPNNELISDLNKILELYSQYVADSNTDISDISFSDFPGGVIEGKKVYRSHVMRERNPRIIKLVKQQRLREAEELRCDVCGFSFKEKYGKRGENYIEGHHTLGISQMGEGHKTKPEDIALVCSNCHRMIHLKMPMISIEELRSLIKR